jgi:hypothetical protein
MSKYRPGKENDQENIDNGIDLIYALMEDNPQIEPTLWAASIIRVLVNGYKNSKMSHNEFKFDMHSMIDYYREFFEEEE